MEPRHRRKLICLGKILVVVVVLAAFFFLGWMFALYDRHELPDHAGRYRELPEQRAECVGLHPSGWLCNRYTLYSQTEGRQQKHRDSPADIDAADPIVQ